MTQHGVIHRALQQEHVARSAFATPGAFGRLFPTLPPFVPDDQALVRLNAKMKTASEAGGEADNQTISAGYTFLGQFIDHDITLDPTSSLERQNDPESIHNFRTPALELDSVYGAGQGASPHLYDREDRARLLIGVDEKGKPNDLPRNRQGTALLGDPRNDENLIISQLHLAFLKFHNAVVDHLRAAKVQGDIFAEAQQIVRWHYQWIVVHEFLPRIIGTKMRDSIMNPLLGSSGQPQVGNTLDTGLKYYVFKTDAYIPVEFAVAAYRFGHSQVRAGYQINNNFRARLFPDPANPGGPTLFVRDSLTTTNVLLDGRTIEWGRFFEATGTPTPPGKKIPVANTITQRSMQINAQISPSLFALPGFPTDDPKNPNSLPLRNLQRGATFGLPWGQRVAAALRVRPKDILSDAELGLAGLGFPPRRAPLWYYVLKEAEVKEKGERLGEVGGRIVGEVLIGLLHGDQQSYISQDPLWDPSKQTTGARPLKAATPGKFTMVDLLRVAGVLP